MRFNPKKRWVRGRVAAGGLAGVVIAGGVAGCAGDRAVVQVEPARGPGGARWEAVVLPEGTAASVAEMDEAWGAAWWEGRRDAAMAMRAEGPLLATDEWPQATRPSMDRARYTTLPTRPETILYFRPENGFAQPYW